MIELMIHCEAKALLFDPWFPEIAAQVHKELPQIEHFIGMGDNLPDFCIDYEKLVDKSSSKEPEVEISEEDYQFFNLTSGTTGLPKSYLLNHYNNATGITFIEQNDLTSNDVILTAFPIFGRTGFAWCACSIILGARMVTAVIVKAQDADVVDEDLIQYCKDQLAGFKVPKKLIFSKEPLLKTPTGKVTKYVLVEKYS